MFGYDIRGTPSLGRIINKLLLILVLAYAIVQEPIADAKSARQEGLMLERYNTMPNEWDSGTLDTTRRQVEDELREDGLRVQGSRHAAARMSSEEALRIARKELNRILSERRSGLYHAKDSGFGDGVEEKGYDLSNADEGGIKQVDEYGIRKNAAKKSRYFPEEDDLEVSLGSFELDSLDKFDRFSKKRAEKKRLDGVSKFYEEDYLKENLRAMKNVAQHDDGESYGLKGNAGKKPQHLRRERTGSDEMEDDTLEGGSYKSRVGSRTSDVRGAKPRPHQYDDFAPAGSRGLKSRAGERDPSGSVRRGDTDYEKDFDDLLWDQGLAYESKPKRSFGQKKRLVDNIVRGLRETLRNKREAKQTSEESG